MSTEWLLGINSVAAALEKDAINVLELRYAQENKNTRVTELVEIAKNARIANTAVARTSMDRQFKSARHQDIAALYKPPAALDETEMMQRVEAAGRKALVLILDGVTDPHNLGACLRSAEAAGVCVVVVPKDRASPVTAVVRIASAGAADRVPLARVTNLARAMEKLREAGVWITGLEGETNNSLYQCDFNGPTAIAMGSEGEGLRRLTKDNCDYLAKIPMQGSVESLNVSVATGISLFEVLRQRSAARPSKK